MREDLPEDLTADLVEQEIRRHSDTRHTIDKEYAETVAMGKALIERMQLPPLYREDGTPNRPPHLLEESLADLEERKMAWERVWQDRDNKLRHWLKLGDYEEQMREVTTGIYLFIAPFTLSYLCYTVFRSTFNKRATCHLTNEHTFLFHLSWSSWELATNELTLIFPHCTNI